VIRGTTRDALFGGRVALIQPARGRGYRVNVDAVLLAEFAAASGRRARSVVDLGAGVGAVALSLLHFDRAERGTMVEIDGLLAALAEANARENGWTDRLDVIHADVREAAKSLAGSADLVVCNPPYISPGRGRAPSAPRVRAKSGDLGTFLDAARRVMGRRARACFVYPAIEATSLFAELRARGLEPKRLRFVHPKLASPARIALVECAAGKAGGLVVLPPVIA
jgi:tRNA1Val (adenine37-N6)-methyltransferase